MTRERYKGAYFGVVNVDTVRTDFSLVHTNDLEVSAAYSGNEYLHGCT